MSNPDESEKALSQVPEDLSIVLERTTTVKRYEDPRYPAGMIEDNLFEHLTRLVNLASNLKIGDELKARVIRTIWIHDLPEIQLGDLPAVLKADRLAAEHDELAVARQLLSEIDLELYENYERSSAFLKGKADTYDDAGLITKVLDSIEGNIYFHKHVSSWVEDGNTDLPPDSALVYTFSQRDNYLTRISAISEPSIKELLTGLLDWELEQVKYMWQENTKGIPEIIKEKLNS